MKCKRCKREIADNSLFCNWCGSKQIKDGKLDVPPPKRLASGEYVGRVMVNGNRERIKAATEAEYYKKARAYKLELVDKINNPQNLLLDDIIKDYIEKNEPIFSVSTVRGYESYKKQIKNIIDDKVSSVNWQKLINDLSGKYSPKTVRNQWGLITASLNDKKIPVPEVKLPAAVKTERHFLEPDEIKVFIKAIRGKSYELPALLALHSLRVSEIYALTKDSVKDGVIHVRGAVVQNKNHKFVKKDENKNVTSTRDVPVFIPRLTELWGALNGDPKFPHQSSFTKDITRVCKHNALPPVNAHGLRHTFCSAAYFLGWDIMTTEAVGGWRSPRVPTEIYTHLSKNRYNEDIAKMKKFYE